MKNVLIAALLVLAGFANAATVPTPTTQPWGTSLVEKDSRGLGIGKMKIVDANGTTVLAGNISSVTDASGATVPATSNFSTTQTLSGAVSGATIALNGGATLSVFITDLTSGTIFPYVSNDGLAWMPSYYEIRGYGVAGARLAAISISGAYTVNVSGWKYFRLGSVGISGTATATINVSAAASTGTLENIADNTYATNAAVLAASANTPADPGYMKISKTAEAGQVSLALTATAATQYTQLLAAPGAGLRYSINWANWTYSNGCTCTARTAMLTYLVSSGTPLPGTYMGFDIPQTVNSTVGSMLPFQGVWPFSFLPSGYNEPLGIKFTASPANAVAGPCLFTLNLGYSIIQ